MYGIIIGHRAKSDRERTIVCKVTISDDPNDIAVYEKKTVVERAIGRYVSGFGKPEVEHTCQWKRDSSGRIGIAFN